MPEKAYNALFAAVFLAIAAGALAFRLPDLAGRPMHCDESNQAVKAGMLFEKGIYRYDPHEHHGPTLYYLTLPFLWLSGATSFAETTEVPYRLVPLVFGVGLVVLLWSVRSGIGSWAVLWAGLFMAVSHAMVFYSRYYIQEMLLVFFAFCVIVAGWRYGRSSKMRWAIVMGLFLGLTHATKETCVVIFAAMCGALVLTVAWARWRDGLRMAAWPRPRPMHVAVCALTALAVSVTLYSSFFTHWRGPLDSVLSYATYLGRSEGTGSVSIHDKPWHYYLHTLLYTYRTAGPRWTEGLIIGLGLIGVLASLVRRSALESSIVTSSKPAVICARGRVALRGGPLPVPRDRVNSVLPSVKQTSDPVEQELDPTRCGFAALGNGHDTAVAETKDKTAGHTPSERSNSPTPDPHLLRFLAFYTVLLTIAYSLIPYKTPWNLLVFLHPMILMAGLGASALIRAGRFWPLKAVVCVLLALGVLHAAQQTRLGVFLYGADPRNPYVYAHTSSNLLRLVRRVDDIAAVHPDGKAMQINIFRLDGDYWPLPWYLRAYTRVGYWTSLPDPLDAPMIIAGPELEPILSERLKEPYQIEYYSLRPGVLLHAYTRQDLWDRFMASRS